jgi:hypothetical protein
MPSNGTGAIGPQSAVTELSRPPGVAPQSIHYVRCIMSARITPKGGLPRFDPVELMMLLLGVAALTLVAVVL